MTKPQKNFLWGAIGGVLLASLTGIGAKVKSKL